MPSVGVFLEKVLPFSSRGQWLSIDEIAELTKSHPASIRWCMKQLKTGAEGNYLLKRRKRQGVRKEIFEFYLQRQPVQLRLPFQEAS
jgi:DNA-binding transcriptional regulator GbsR (MarR family)